MSLCRLSLQHVCLKQTFLTGRSNGTNWICRLLSTTDPAQWDVYAGLCLQRPPIIAPELNWFEKRIKNLLEKVEISNSLYSDHEMRHFEDM